MKIKVTTAGGQVLALVDVLSLLSMKALNGEGPALRPGSVVIVDAIATEHGATVTQANDADGGLLRLHEIVVVPELEPCR